MFYNSPKKFMLYVHGFDVLDGIERRYTPYYVTATAPQGTNPEAAVAEAVYTTLLALYPAQETTLDDELIASLNNIEQGPASPDSIAKGQAWGQSVANQILALRANDHFNDTPSPFYGDLLPGDWRPTAPNVGVPGGLYWYQYITPFALTSTSQFRPAPPPALSSAQYAADENEVEAVLRAYQPPTHSGPDGNRDLQQ